MNVSTNYKILSMNHNQMGKTLLLLAVMQRWEIYVLYIFGEYFNDLQDILYSCNHSQMKEPCCYWLWYAMMRFIINTWTVFILMNTLYTVLQWTMISSLVMQLMVITRFENVFLLGCSLQQWEINLYACIKLAQIYRWYFSGL